MKTIILKCEACSYIKETTEDYLFDNRCPLCNSKMIPVIDQTDINEIVMVDLIEQMKKNLIQLGSNKVWSIIEGLANPKQRIRYRKVFLDAGGIVPDKEF
jgi:predicted DCC family thiol-disulfide oxidoreductase YuxK